MLSQISQLNKMQALVRSCQETLRLAVLTHSHLRHTGAIKRVSSTFGCVASSIMQKGMVTESPTMQQNKGLENMTVAEVLMTKGEEKVGSWIWCRSDDTVQDAVKKMAQHNIGSLVVLKPGDEQLIAGIFTERDYMRKMILQERCCKHIKVMEIMTEQKKLITVTSDTNILQAMQVMTENQIRHVPVIDGRIVGMISIVDVVRAVVEQQSGEVKRLNDFIKGDYY